jgi:hypothetical protein
MLPAILPATMDGAVAEQDGPTGAEVVAPVPAARPADSDRIPGQLLHVLRC